MSFSSKEKLSDYMYKILSRFNVSDFKDFSPQYFETSIHSLQDDLKRKKLVMNKKNLSTILLLKIKNNDWSINDIIKTAFALELDYVIKYSNRFNWIASKFMGDSNQNEISDLGDSIRATIRSDKQDASVLVKESGDFFWISISMKKLKKIGIFERPHYIVVSADGQYCFTKDNRSASVLQYVTTTLGYEREKRKKLSGKSLPTLLKLLLRKEKADLNNRPVYEGGEAEENEFGIDFTQKKSYIDYYNRCVDNDEDINLQSYTVASINNRWMGDDNPILREMEFKSVLTLSGDVARIIKQLPITSIVKPPLPNYLRNFSVHGRNVLSIKPSLS